MGNYTEGHTELGKGGGKIKAGKSGAGLGKEGGRDAEGHHKGFRKLHSEVRVKGKEDRKRGKTERGVLC